MRSFRRYSLAHQGMALAWQGDTCAARPRPKPASRPRPSLAALTPASPTRHWVWRPWPLGMLRPRGTQPRRPGSTRSVPPGMRGAVRAHFSAQAALAGGDLVAARRWADEAVATATGWYS